MSFLLGLSKQAWKSSKAFPASTAKATQGKVQLHGRELCLPLLRTRASRQEDREKIPSLNLTPGDTRRGSAVRTLKPMSESLEMSQQSWSISIEQTFDTDRGN